jgi:transposase
VRTLGKTATFLFEDETLVRLFPPLRAKWAPTGTQPVVRITGRNDRRVLFGTLNPRTGHRVIMRGRSMRQEEFQAFLRLLHKRYRGRRLHLILDEVSCHTAQGSRRLAERLGIGYLTLPKQSPQLNPVDHLWRPAKGRMAANRQYRTVDQGAQSMERFILHLSPTRALKLAGILSDNFWLRDVR